MNLATESTISGHPRPSLLILLIAIAAFLLILSGCTSSYYITAQRLHSRGNYVGAIENYDEFINRTKDGATRILALNNRSQAYYDMGLEQMRRNNFRLAIRLLYLSNTLQADEKMVDCYLSLAENSYLEGDLKNVITIYDFIIETYDILPVIPSVIHKRLQLYHEHYKDIDKVWNDFVLLVDRYNDKELIEKSVPVIDKYVPALIERAVNLRNSFNYETAIRELLVLENYPHSYHQNIREAVGLLLFELADANKKEQRFFQAYETYELVKVYHPPLEEKVNQRFNEMVSQMIEHGNELLDKRNTGEAKKIFNLTFDIIPDNRPAKEAIERAERLAEDIRIADEIYRQALVYENDEKYEEALRLYKQSLSRDRLPRTEEKIFLMTNLIEIEKNPIAFARRIITEYRNGIIVRNIQSRASMLREIYGDSVRESDWRIMLSTGTHRYEVRYDIISPADNYFLIWQVNLLNRNIVPLNKESEEVMGG